MTRENFETFETLETLCRVCRSSERMLRSLTISQELRVHVWSTKDFRSGRRSRCKSATLPGSRRARTRTQRPRAFNDDNDVELAVFRFTLGIPGFDDALIPRVVGIVGITLLLLNHVLSGNAGGSQTVTETIGAALAAVGIAAPALQKRIEESTPGRGRRKAVENLEGASNVFAISESLSEEQKREAAWASFAIIKNANVCGVFISAKGSPVLCRGALGVDIGTGANGSGADYLLNAQAEYEAMEIAPVATEYYETRSRIDASPLRKCSIVPSGAGGVAVLPIKSLTDDMPATPSAGSMLLVCDRERAMSAKEMAWCESICSKLYSILSS
jgi:hypothetical protein